MEDKILSREHFLTVLVDDVARSPLIERQFKERCAGIDALKAHDSALRDALQEAQQEVLLLTAAYDSFAGLLGFARNASRDDIEQRLLELRADRDKWRERHEQVTADLAKERETSRELREALGDIAHKTCGSQCNDPERKPRLLGSARCAKCIATDVLARLIAKGGE